MRFYSRAVFPLLCDFALDRDFVAKHRHALLAGAGGRILEIGLSPEPKVSKWQHRLNWLQMRLAGGCHLDRDMRVLVSAQPFGFVKIDEFYLEKIPKTHGYMYRGMARK